MEYKEVLNIVETGDIIGQSYADERGGPFGLASFVFEKATGPMSHVGLIHVKKSLFGRKVFVIEATDPYVKRTPFEEFVSYGNERRFCIFRYKNGLTTQQKEKLMRRAYEWTKSWHQFWKKETKYDLCLSSGDQELYCSELIDKAYQAIGINLINKYMSLEELKQRIMELFSKGDYDEKSISAAKAFGIVWGPQGYYYDPDANMLAKDIVTPYDIVVNGNTKKIFSNMPGI